MALVREHLFPAVSPKHTNGTTDDGMVSLKVKKLTHNSYLPTRGSIESAGYDLYRYITMQYIVVIKCYTAVLMMLSYQLKASLL